MKKLIKIVRDENLQSYYFLCGCDWAPPCPCNSKADGDYLYIPFYQTSFNVSLNNGGAQPK